MNISGPTPIVTQQSVASARVTSITVDLVNATMRVHYRSGAAGAQSGSPLSAPVPLTAAIVTQLESIVQSAIEKAQGWAPGSSAITVSAAALNAIVHPPTPAPAPTPMPAKAST